MSFAALPMADDLRLSLVRLVNRAGIDECRTRINEIPLRAFRMQKLLIQRKLYHRILASQSIFPL